MDGVANGTVTLEIDGRLREFMRGEIDYHTLLIALIRIFDADPSARAIALERIDLQEPPGALQRGFMRVLKERIEGELTPPATPLATAPEPEPQPFDEPVTEELPAAETAVALEPSAEPVELEEPLEEPLIEAPAVTDFPPGSLSEERFVARRRVPWAAPRRRGGYGNAVPPPPARAPSVGWNAPAAPEWHPSRIVPARADDDEIEPPAQASRGRKLAHMFLWLTGLGLIAFALSTPIKQQISRLTAVYEEVPAAFRPEPQPTPPAAAAAVPDRIDTRPPESGSPPAAVTPAPAPIESSQPSEPSAAAPVAAAPTKEAPTPDAAPATDKLVTAAPRAPAAASPPAPPSGPGRLGFATGAYRVSEGDAMVALTIERTNGSTGAASIAWWTKQGSAHAEDDYADLGPRVESFEAGETTRQIYVPIVSDAVFEGSETFSVLVTEPEGAQLGRITSATVTINDDDR